MTNHISWSDQPDLESCGNPLKRLKSLCGKQITAKHSLPFSVHYKPASDRSVVCLACIEKRRELRLQGIAR